MKIRRQRHARQGSAAELNGASHQRSMVFQVMADERSVRSVRSWVKNGVRLEMTLCNSLPLDYVTKVKTQMGPMNVSGPELTALDCVAHEQKVGGMSRVAEIVAELCESLSCTEDKLKLLDYFTSATIQRLGYIIEALGEDVLSDKLYGIMMKTGKYETDSQVEDYRKFRFTCKLPWLGGDAVR